MDDRFGKDGGEYGGDAGDDKARLAIRENESHEACCPRKVRTCESTGIIAMANALPEKTATSQLGSRSAK